MASATIFAPVTTRRMANSAVARVLTHASIVVADVIALTVAGGSAVLLRHVFNGQFAPHEYAGFAPCILLFLLVFGISGLYPGIGTSPIEEFRLILRACTTGFLLLAGGIFFLRTATLSSRLIMVLAWLFTIILVPPCRRFMRGICTRQSWWGIPAVILGTHEAGVKILELLEGHRRVGLRPVALLSPDHPQTAHALPSCPHVLFGQLSDSSVLAREYLGCYAVLAMPGEGSDEPREAFMQYAQNYRNLLIIPDLFGMRSLAVSTTDLCGHLALRIDQPLARFMPQVAKRCFDLVIAVGTALAISPVILGLYLAVRFSSPGPVFYGQRRIGKNGEEFTVHKFRSMVVDADAVLARHLESDPALRAEWECDHKLKVDPRVTWIGNFLRKTSLDEVPQLWNVIVGDMSVVGPRPIVNAEIKKYGAVYDQYCLVTPGVTGLWQVSGRNNTTYDLRTRIDDYYIRNWSLSMDIYIVFRTVKTLLLREGAY